MTASLPPEQVRITDEDRRLAEQRLRNAHEDGSIDLTEFDLRVSRLWQETKTRGDLVGLTVDLPAPPVSAPPPAPRGGANAMRVLTAIWLSASAVNFVVWLLVTVMTVDPLYPWWLWVLLPPGSVLGVLWTMGFGRRR